MKKEHKRFITNVLAILLITVISISIMNLRVSAWPAVTADSEWYGAPGSYSSAIVEYKSINPDNFTDKDLKDFTDALENTDYKSIETKSGKDYNIVRISLKNGYAVEIVTRSDNEVIAEMQAAGQTFEEFSEKNIELWGLDVVSSHLFNTKWMMMIDVVYLNPKSEKIAGINYNAYFKYNYSQVGIESFNSTAGAEIHDISFPDVAITGGEPSLSVCTVYAAPKIQIGNKILGDFAIGISCDKKGVSSSEFMPPDKAEKNLKYQESLKNNSYTQLKFYNVYPNWNKIVLSKEEFIKVFNSVSALGVYETKASITSKLDRIDGKYEKIDLKNGYYLELRIQIMKLKKNLNNVLHNVYFSVTGYDDNNTKQDIFSGSISMYSEWDGKTVTASPPKAYLNFPAEDFMIMSTSSKITKDKSSATGIITVGSAFTKTAFNIELTSDKNGGITVRISK